MAEASYFPRDVMQQLGFPNVLIEYFRNQFERSGGSGTLVQDLSTVNTTITTITESVEATDGEPISMVPYLVAENERLKRRIEHLEALL